MLDSRPSRRTYRILSKTYASRPCRMSSALPRSRRGEQHKGAERDPRRGPGELTLRGLRTRSSDYIALRLLLSRLACLLWRESRLLHRVPSPFRCPCLLSVCYLPAGDEGKTQRRRQMAPEASVGQSNKPQFCRTFGSAHGRTRTCDLLCS